MWNDVKIGEGNHGNSAIRVFTVTKGNISENHVSYWISDCMCYMGMVIMKNTVHGQKITKMISDGIVDERLQDYLDTILLKNVSPAQLKVRIQQALDDAYDKGKEMKADEIRRVLGIREY